MQLTKTFPKQRSYFSTLQSKQLSVDGSEIPAVDSVTIEIESGTVFGLIGPNGAGKTTLVRMLSTLVIPTKGTALINGYDIDSEGNKVRESIGLAVGGERSFYWRLTGSQNLEFFAAMQGLNGRILRRRVTELFELFDLVDAADKPYRFYSAGMKRKLDLARALVTDPPILLLDEPTTAVDPYAAIKIRQIIYELRSRGKTILLVTHNLSEAEKLCDTIGLMNRGKLIATGSVTTLKALADNCRITIITRLPDERAQLSKDLSDLYSIKIVKSHDRELVLLIERKEDTVTSVLKSIAHLGYQINSLNIEQPTLEDIFFKLVGANIQP